MDELTRDTIKLQMETIERQEEVISRQRSIIEKLTESNISLLKIINIYEGALSRIPESEVS